MSESRNASDFPVTVVAAHQVKPGKEKAFEETMSGMIQAAMTFEGHLGANVLRPTSPSAPQYRIIFKFDRMSNLHHWETSQSRHEWLLRLADLTQDKERSKLQVLTGLETWFTLPAQVSVVPPPRYKMALLTWLGIFPLIILINLLFEPVLTQLPLPVRSLVLTAVLVFVMTYIVMPRVTRLFARWLYPSISRSHKQGSRPSRKQHHRNQM